MSWWTSELLTQLHYVLTWKTENQCPNVHNRRQMDWTQSSPNEDSKQYLCLCRFSVMQVVFTPKVLFRGQRPTNRSVYGSTIKLKSARFLPWTELKGFCSSHPSRMSQQNLHGVSLDSAKTSTLKDKALQVRGHWCLMSLLYVWNAWTKRLRADMLWNCNFTGWRRHTGQSPPQVSERTKLRPLISHFKKSNMLNIRPHWDQH